MHYKKKNNITIKSTTYLIESSIFNDICKIANFYNQSVSKIIEEALLFQRIDREDYLNEKELQKKRKYYKKGNFQCTQRRNKVITKKRQEAKPITESLFD